MATPQISSSFVEDMRLLQVPVSVSVLNLDTTLMNNSIKIAERTARFSQSSMNSQTVVYLMSTPSDFRASFLQDVTIFGRVNLFFECGDDAADTSEIHYADQIRVIGLGQIIS
jgi:hypothetical protein